jgi:hypothetical protein
MYYWNKDNFEGLLGIGNSFKGEDGFELFAEYCFLKEKGLKKQAVKVIKDYVNHLKKLDLNKQREITREITRTLACKVLKQQHKQ